MNELSAAVLAVSYHSLFFIKFLSFISIGKNELMDLSHACIADIYALLLNKGTMLYGTIIGESPMSM